MALVLLHVSDKYEQHRSVVTHSWSLDQVAGWESQVTNTKYLLIDWFVPRPVIRFES